MPVIIKDGVWVIAVALCRGSDSYSMFYIIVKPTENRYKTGLSGLTDQAAWCKLKTQERLRSARKGDQNGPF